MSITEALQILELTPPITRAALKKAYRDALMVWHPDRFSGNHDLQKKAASRTYVINESYNLLCGLPESAYPYQPATKPKQNSSFETNAEPHETPGANDQASRPREGSSRAVPRKQAGQRKTEPDKHGIRHSNVSRWAQFDRISLIAGGVGVTVLVLILIFMSWKQSAPATTQVTSAELNSSEVELDRFEPLRRSPTTNTPTSQIVAPTATSGEDVGDGGAGAFQKGLMHYHGMGVPENKALGVTWFRKAAEQGSLEAQAQLGDCSFFGDGIAMNKSEAVKWYLKAGEGGHPYAQRRVGECYSEGIEKNYSEAVKWYLRAATQNDHNSKIWLGVAFEKGEGADLDYVEAHKWYALAKAQRETESAADRKSGKQSLQSYVLGRGDCLGIEWLEAKLTLPELQESARRQLAFSSTATRKANEAAGFRSSPAAATGDKDSLDYAQQAAARGDVWSQLTMADAYYFGRGVHQDFTEAVMWWRKAAEQNDSDAQYNLGRCYATGEGVERNVQEAIRWYKRAADQGNSDAQYNLAVCYATGNGLPTDLAEATRLSLLSANQGNARAQLNLGNCYKGGVGVLRDEREAAKWYHLAAEQGNADAQFYLGLAYGGGVGVPDDDVEAYKWYLLAASQNHDGAKKLLLKYKVFPDQLTAAKQRVVEFEQSLVAKRDGMKASSGRLKKNDGPASRVADNVPLIHLPSDSRLASGSILVDKLAALNGMGKLTLANGLTEDACVKLVQNSSLAASFYVRGGESFTFDHVPDGAYTVLFCTGFDWNAIKRDFARGRHARRYDSPISFSTKKTREGNSIVTSTDVVKLTLHAVPDGNAQTSDVSLEEFDRY